MGDEEVFAESNVAGLVGSWQARQDHGEIDGMMAGSMGSWRDRWDHGEIDEVRCFEAGLRDRMLFGRPYRK